MGVETQPIPVQLYITFIMGQRKPGLTRADTIPGGGSVNPGDYLSAGLCDPGDVGAMGEAQVGGGHEGYVSPS